MEKSKNPLLKIDSTIGLRKEVCEADSFLSSFSKASKEIENVDGCAARDECDGGSKSVRVFFFRGNPFHENVEPKTVLLRHQCLEQVSHLASSKLKNIGRKWHCESMKNC